MLSELPILPATRAFLERKLKMRIGADWQDAASGRTLSFRNPATGEVLGEVPAAEAEDVDRAVRAARQAFDDSPWSRMRPRERQNLLWRLADLMERDARQLAELECLNNGKSAAVAQMMDVQLAIDFLRYMAGWATKIEGSTVEASMPLMPNDQFHGFVRREAVGVVGAIVAWNFPLLLACWKLGPALATGCTVVLKPADETPLSVLKLAELVDEAGYPAGVFNVVTGTGLNAGCRAQPPPRRRQTDLHRLHRGRQADRQGGHGQHDPRHPGTGRQIADHRHARRQPAGSRSRCGHGDLLQPGPGVLRRLAAVCAPQALRQCGGRHRRDCQCHEAGQRAGPGGADGPADFSQAAGPRHRLHRARPRTGRHHRLRGEGFGPGYFVKPTVIVDVDQRHRLVQEEIFGPVLVAMPFDDIDEVIGMANDNPYGLGASIWSNDLAAVHRMIPRIKSGSVWVNCHSALDPALPFGGYKMSGVGREMGSAAIEHYTELKSVLIKL